MLLLRGNHVNWACQPRRALRGEITRDYCLWINIEFAGKISRRIRKSHERV